MVPGIFVPFDIALKPPALKQMIEQLLHPESCQRSVFRTARRTFMSIVCVAFTLSAIPGLTLGQEGIAPTHWATSKINMVASVNPIATEAGLQAFRDGGNAVDAAIATALTLGVVDGFNSGIGGGCFILIRSPDGTITAIDGREMAPSAASRDLYRVDGKIDSSLAQTGALASGVPGAAMAYVEAVNDHGGLDIKTLLKRAAQIAEDGFVVNRGYSAKLKAVRKHLVALPHSASILLHTDGSIYLPGETLRQRELAETYRQLANKGTDWFYRGPFAAKTAEWMKANGGLITADDFAKYQTVVRQPVRSTYRGYEIVGFPPPSSGGVHVAQILNILENFDLAAIHRESPGEMLHIVAEAMKLAFADRAYWLGDPDFVNVPTGLITKEYAKALAAKIDRKKITTVLSHGTPPDADGKFFARHTTHIAAADSSGYWVAITTTVNTTFGSKVIVPGLGVVMNNQMDDFSIAPGTRNSFGLIGAENNSVAGGKRPLSSMSPTIVLLDGRPVFTTGAAGGPKIITDVVWAIINRVDFGMSAAEAIAQPRIHHQWSPDRLRVETTLSKLSMDHLEAAGHQLDRSTSAGVCQAISFDAETGLFHGAYDPRVEGQAAGTDRDRKR